MRFLFFLLFWGAFSLSAEGQSLDSLIHDFNASLKAYLAINPHDKPLDLDSTHLSEAEKRRYLKASGPTKTTIEPIELQEIYAGYLDSALSLIFKQPHLLDRPLSEEFDCKVILTEDRRFLQLSYDENAGGTYRSRVVHYLYRGPHSRFQSIYTGEGPRLKLDSDGYHRLEFLGERRDTLYYFFTGGVRGCSYCFSSSIGIIAAHRNGLEELEKISIDSRSWTPTIHIEEETDSSKRIFIKHQVDDLSGPCYCEGSAKLNRDQSGEALFCTYTYWYENFRLHLLKQGCEYRRLEKTEELED